MDSSIAERNRLHGLSFGQLRPFVTYKAKLAGIPVIAVDPRNTCRCCPECGVIDKPNRKIQVAFSCVHRGAKAV
jgi:transposase